jgi:hypothetical protein
MLQNKIYGLDNTPSEVKLYMRIRINIFGPPTKKELQDLQNTFPSDLFEADPTDHKDFRKKHKPYYNVHKQIVDKKIKELPVDLVKKIAVHVLDHKNNFWVQDDFFPSVLMFVTFRQINQHLPNADDEYSGSSGKFINIIRVYSLGKTQIHSEISYEIKCKYRTIQLGKFVMPNWWFPFQSKFEETFILDQSSILFSKISKFFCDEPDKTDTIIKSPPNIKQIKIVQNVPLFNSYNSQRIFLVSKDVELNEKLLFHKPGSDNVIINIQQHGFNELYSKNNNLWGQGIYFAERIDYIDIYWLCTEKTVIMSHVSLGDIFNYGTLTNPGLIRLPINIETKKYYDSLSGITKNEIIYKIPNGISAYPSFIVTYDNGNNNSHLE